MIAGNDDLDAMWLLTKPMIETGNLAQPVTVCHEISCMNQDIAIRQAHALVLAVGVADTNNLQLSQNRYALEKRGLDNFAAT